MVASLTVHESSRVAEAVMALVAVAATTAILPVLKTNQNTAKTDRVFFIFLPP
jgi:hypothetical protein